MTIYSCYIFNRQGVCLHSGRWHQQPKSAKALEHEQRLLWGVLFSIRDFVQSMAPKTLDELEHEPFTSFNTNEYKVHYYETLNGMRFVLFTDLVTSTQKVQEVLQNLHKLYVEFAVKNPLVTPSPSVLPLPPSSAAVVAGSSLPSASAAAGSNPAVSTGTTAPPSTPSSHLPPLFVTKFDAYVESLPFFH